MKRPNITFLFAILLSMVGVEALAHDFVVGSIYYDKLSDTEVAVTFRGETSYPENSYSGKVVIPEKVTNNGYTYTVTKIGGRAFIECTKLTSVTIPNSVNQIEYAAFRGCTALTNISIPNSVTEIGAFAFEDCPGITSIPNNLTSVGAKAFYNTPWYNKQPDGFVYISNILYSYKGDIPNNTTIIIDEETTEIAGYAFYYCNNKFSIIIPNNVTKIGCFAFKSLKSLTIGTGVKNMGDDWGAGNGNVDRVIWLTSTPPTRYGELHGKTNYVPNDLYTGLENMTIYKYMNAMFEVDGVKYVPVNPSERTCDAIDSRYDETVEHISIGNSVEYKGVTMTVQQVLPYTFAGNPYIKDVQIDFTGTMGQEAFSGCTGLESLTIADGQTEVAANEFADCTSLKNITIGNGVTAIGDNAFTGCTSLETFSIGNGVTAIGKEAFSGCSSLTNFTLGSSVEAIGQKAFSGCTQVAKIVSQAATPPTCDSQVLDDVDKWNCKIVVPEGATEAYQAADQWKDFFFIVDEDEPAISLYKLTYIVDDETWKTVDLAVGADITAEEAPQKEGYTFSGWNGLPETMPDHDVTVSAIYTKNDAPAGVTGDLNGDGELNMIDVVLLVKLILSQFSGNQ